MNNKEQKAISAIKAFLINSDRNLLTITEGLVTVKKQAEINMTRREFQKLIEKNLLVKTDRTQNSQGTPKLYKLNEIFLTENSYQLDENEIILLLEKKKLKLRALNNQVEKIQKQNQKLNHLYRLSLKIKS